ncbi:hypothetical protein [Pelagibaculum spongiae]|uniref:Uncharacterized protein n=1 Tax=Pelagibaculum spongiae TaxID=2080658 RepID=A0A2V1GVQ1_9GAMM|nr:hypothetical protein [Pelagibaculum spongiae]PVZ64481.1 hypothetical protein DC094_19400 [Pelagibaculum spongiae]
MIVITVKRDNDKDIKFTGELLASVAARECPKYSDYSPHTWLNLYINQSGSYICEKIEELAHEDYKRSFTATSCNDQSEIFDFFGNDDQAKMLYEKAGLENVERIA